jgi:uncharacterized protein YukJ
MPLESYGVLKARILDRRVADGRDPHYHLLCGVGTARWRVAINSRSDVAPSEVEQAVITDFGHPILETVEALNEGWHRLERGLDFVRGDLCTPDQFTPLPLTKPGADNDLNESFDFHLRRDARIYAFGEPWGPEKAKDPYFGFTPGRGIHDVHANQGNQRQFQRDDGVFQDGGLIVAARTGWTAILLRFQSQSWNTDPRTGHSR